ncbi:sperm acrosome membrane-associated protein 4 [Betta splendens]|uniref:Sperm acrosome membrane-associated protein 4 n=1 Tax=Betta splendens TaxID=158456 RepID=A0A6P7P0V5_BETSP|nr:sperm acrosome membrane-associated protein 4 [Betta splendens]
MTGLLWSCAAVVALFITVESLTCYTCDVEVFDSCFKKTEVNCSDPHDICFKGVAKIHGDLSSIHARGCIQPSDCRNDTVPILNVNYTITRHCCSTDLCNGAASTQLPLATALCGALVAVWSQWGL